MSDSGTPISFVQMVYDGNDGMTLVPNHKQVLGLIPRLSGGLSVWHVHVLSMPSLKCIARRFG